MVHKLIIVSVHILCVSLQRLKSFPVVVGGPQSDYSVCPRPLCQFTQVKKFSGGWWWWWVVHKGIIVSVRVLCVSLHRLKSFPAGGGGGPQNDYILCLRSLHSVIATVSQAVRNFMSGVM